MAEGECKALSLLLRIAALGLSVAAAVVMATASQLVMADGGREPSSYYFVSYSQYSALRYFVAAGAISAVCSAAALYLSAVRGDDAVAWSLRLAPFLDAAALGFLFSAAGAAFGAVGAGLRGSSGAGGGGSSVCDAAGAFCGRVSVAAAVSAIAAVAAAAAAALARDAAGRGSSSGGRHCDC